MSKASTEKQEQKAGRAEAQKAGSAEPQKAGRAEAQKAGSAEAPAGGRPKEQTKRRTAELLAPAGGEAALIAAVENGADAVYCGGRLFNARQSAANFSDEAMREAIGFVHEHDVRIHVTMNTLLRDDELREAFRYAEFLYEAGADALIVQDLGLAGLLHRYLPDLPLHLSTQGTAVDADTVRAAGKLGFSRVVLARELTLGEIRRIADETELELETFVHGALCVCYSGQCQMSRYFGGRSGNRGTCAQPCRLPYRTMDRDGWSVPGAPAYPLSPKDLCLLDDLGGLIESGVCSLKIEGRMKSPEYVAVVVRIYRKYLDQYAREGRIRVSREDREEIAQIFNRGGFTKGFFAGDPGKAFLTDDIPKHRGIEIGKVTGRPNRRPDRRGPMRQSRRPQNGLAAGGQEETLVDIRLEKPLSIGDGIEIHGRSLAGGVLSYYKDLGGGVVRVGDIRGDIAPGDIVFRTSSRAQLQAARRTFEGRTLAGSEPGGAASRRLPVRFLAEADAAGRLTLTAEAAGRPGRRGRAERCARRLWPCVRRFSLCARRLWRCVCGPRRFRRPHPRIARKDRRHAVRGGGDPDLRRRGPADQDVRAERVPPGSPAEARSDARGGAARAGL